MKNIIILMMLISFGSIGAVFFTPGLPEIARYFAISNSTAGMTVTWYLIGYTFAQLLYGPMVHSLGSRNTIIICGILALIGSALSIFAGLHHSFALLLLARAIMALGAGGGLKMAFTLSSHLYTKNESARVISLLTMAFAIMPGLGVFIGGILVNNFGWISSFYLMVVYSVVIILVSFLLPEMYSKTERHKFHFSEMLTSYGRMFSSRAVISGGLLLGVCSGLVYAFAALAPFIAIEMMGITPNAYGSYNLIPVIGVVGGALSSNYCGKFWQPHKSLKFGLLIISCGIILLLLGLSLWHNAPLILFMPMIIIYFGSGFVYGNTTALALHSTEDKSNASAVVSFLNMASSCLLVLVLGTIQIQNALILPLIYIALVFLGVIWYRVLLKST
ncbi:MAG: MFS transporter [Burkholderiales bacterium]|nr:MFS transporter [Burkholderiales bacterium]